MASRTERWRPVDLPDTILTVPRRLPGGGPLFGWTGRCQPHPAPRRGRVKSAEEIMEILEGFDLTASFRDAAELAGCSPNTVARYVADREAGTLVPGRAERRPSVIDEFLPKLEEL